jgi:putative membrane protein
VRPGAAVAFVLGLACAAAATVYAGTGAVVRALQSLHVTGLLLIAVLHLPIGMAMGLAWWLVSGKDPHASRSRFIWARFVRDAAAEVLPFSQIGGFVLGVRALGPGRATIARGTVSMSVDLLIELAAKLPYVAAGLAALLVLPSQPGLARPLAIALLLTCAAAAVPLIAHNRLRAWLEAAAREISRRWPSLAGIESDVPVGFERAFAHRRRLFSSFVLHVFCWFLGAVEAWVLFRLLGAHLDLLQALAIDSAVAGLRTFGFMVPAAAGVQEASYLIGAGVFGISPAVAIAASLARRARDLTLGVATLAIAVPGDPTLLPPSLRWALRFKRDTRSP